MQTLSSAPDPAVSVAVSILAVLLALTGFGLWTALDLKQQSLLILGMIMMINLSQSISKFTKNTKSKQLTIV